jgi:hypothetical protein
VIKKERIQVHIKSDHSRARLLYGGIEFDVPLVSWDVNRGLSLTLPWDEVDLALVHPDTADPLIYESNARPKSAPTTSFSPWSKAVITPAEPTSYRPDLATGAPINPEK